MKIKDLGEPLYGSGNVFSWQDGWIIKLYGPETPREFIIELGQKEKALFDAGVPVADVGELVEIEGYLGQVYEKVEGKSIADEMLTIQDPNSERLIELAHAFAEAHVRVHTAHDIGVKMATQKTFFPTVLGRIEALTPALRKSLILRLEDIPEGNRVCHGDYHPYNVIQSPRGSVVIDWNNSHVGNPLEDVARANLILTGFMLQIPPVAPIVERFRDIYLEHYFSLTGADHAQIEAWWPLVAALRLADPVPELKDWLLGEIRSKLL